MYLDETSGPDGISLCVSNPDWFKQLKGVTDGEKLKLTIEIDVQDSRSVINSKPLPMMKGETEPYEGKAEGKGKKVKEWIIKGKIVSMGDVGEEESEGEENEEAEGGGESEP